MGAVASHLGSGAQIFGLFLSAGVQGREPPNSDEFASIWDEWNAKSPAQQVRDGIRVNAEFIDQVETMASEDRRGWKLEVFGTSQDLSGLLRMRLTEHVLHTWDIEVVEDPNATLLPDAVPTLITQLPSAVRHAARPASPPIDVDFDTTDPSRQVRLRVDTDGATLSLDPLDPPTSGTVSLPGEALIRLIAGRLDPDHCPREVIDEGQQLERLRANFPGY